MITRKSVRFTRTCLTVTHDGAIATFNKGIDGGFASNIENSALSSMDELWKFFISQVRANLHIVLAMSPIGDSFRNRVRMYPALVNNTTIDKFFDWPEIVRLIFTIQLKLKVLMNMSTC